MMPRKWNSAGVFLAMFLATGVVIANRSSHAEMLCERQNIRLAAPIVIENAGEWIRENDLQRGSVELYLSVNSHSDGWTIARGDICLTDGKSRWGLKTPLLEDDHANAGRIESSKALRLVFELPASLDRARPLSLSIQGGIYAWSGGKDSDKFCLTIWRGPRAVPVTTIDAMGRIVTVDASRSTGDIARYEYDIRGAGNTATTRARWSSRLPPGGKVEGTLTVITKDGEKHSADFAANYAGPSAELPREVLVGVCVYPEEELAEEDIAKLEAQGKKEWDGPYRRERHNPNFYIDKAVEEQLGNLIVVWPEVQRTAGWDTDREAARVRSLADKGVYYMTVYQRSDATTVRKLKEAGRSRYFLGNNMGEFASYMYQAASSAEACKVPQEGNLEECRDWFVHGYIEPGAKSYHSSYDLVFSTSGSALGAYELEGGIDVLASELYAIGAANLAYATAEMRGAARKWKPLYWGGWLAHEWQTGSIPFQAEEKFPLLRAGLYQQFLMGSSLIVLESGTQTTQAGVYTAGSGKRNYTYSEAPPMKYRAEMKDFYSYVKAHPRTSGLPEVRFALALGHCDSFVGIFLDWLPQWAQFATAKKNANWLYGTPERSWNVAQDVLFPRFAGATGTYKNAWLAGSPFGQVDICQIDRLTTPQDLSAYRAIAYAGWNSMNDDIANTLRQYVEQGGRLMLCLPHLSIRLDREYREYCASDLLGGGDLSRLLPVTVKGRKTVSGKAVFAGGDFPAPAEDALLSLSGEGIADIEVGAGAQTVCADAAGAPVVVRYARGRGEIILLLTWEYPGKASLAKLYAHMLSVFAASERGDVYITEKGEDVPRCDGKQTAFISYAVYADKIYLLNMDTRESHTFILHQGNRTTDVTLGPVEFRELARQ